MDNRATRRMSVDAFLAWQADQTERHELVGGEPVAMAGAQLRHDRVTGNAFAEVRRQIRSGSGLCDVFTADIGIRTPVGNLRRPDVSVLCPPFDETATSADSPRLIVEVLSESTERVDRLIKLDEYKSIETLDYIVIVDPTRVDAGFWFRDAVRTWRTTTFHDATAIIEMRSLDIAIPLAALYERVQLAPQPRIRLVWDDDRDPASP